MNRLLLLFVFLFSTVPGSAEDEKPLNLFAVGDQEIFLRRAVSLEVSCEAHPLAKVAVIAAPKNGKITERKIETFPSYGKNNSRSKCNENKTPATAAYYQANPGFKGVDKFEFVFVYYDGTVSRFKGKIKVWQER